MSKTKTKKIAISKKLKRYTTAFCLGLLLSCLSNLGIVTKLAPVSGQTLRPETVAERVYQNLPFLPLENEYLSQRTGQTAPSSTLMLRFIRYHEYVKSRPLKHRFDWQLTFADYFEINEPIREKRYPGHQTLTINPLESDRAILTQLTRSQRNQVIDTLLDIYNPQAEVAPKPPVTNPDSLSNDRNNRPSLPQPGDADLLLPN